MNWKRKTAHVKGGLRHRTQLRISAVVGSPWSRPWTEVMQRHSDNRPASVHLKQYVAIYLLFFARSSFNGELFARGQRKEYTLYASTNCGNYERPFMDILPHAALLLFWAKRKSLTLRCLIYNGWILFTDRLCLHNITRAWLDALACCSIDRVCESV